MEHRARKSRSNVHSEKTWVSHWSVLTQLQEDAGPKISNLPVVALATRYKDLRVNILHAWMSLVSQV